MDLYDRLSRATVKLASVITRGDKRATKRAMRIYAAWLRREQRKLKD